MTEHDPTGRPVVVLSTDAQSVDRLFTPTAMKQLTTLFTVVDLSTYPDADAAPGRDHRHRLRRHRTARPAPANGCCARRAEGDLQRRGQLLPQRRLRDLLRARHPRPELRARLRPGGRRVRPRPRARPRPRHHPRRPRVPRRHRALSRRAATPTPSCCTAPTSASSASATSADRFAGCCARSTRCCGCTTRGCPTRAASRRWRDRRASLDEVLERSQFLFVLAAATDANGGLLGACRAGARPAGRAADPAQPRRGRRLRRAARRASSEGRFLAAIDVWPAEPVAADDRARRLDGLVLSATAPAASRPRSSRSATWSSTT